MNAASATMAHRKSEILLDIDDAPSLQPRVGAQRPRRAGQRRHAIDGSLPLWKASHRGLTTP